MPVIQGSTSVAANATVDNVLQGSQFEFLPYDAVVEFGINGSANGLLTDVYTGQDAIAEAMAIAGVNRFPVYPDDFILTDVAAAGERVKIRVRNTTAGALTVFWSVRITPA